MHIVGHLAIIQRVTSWIEGSADRGPGVNNSPQIFGFFLCTFFTPLAGPACVWSTCSSTWWSRSAPGSQHPQYPMDIACWMNSYFWMITLQYLAKWGYCLPRTFLPATSTIAFAPQTAKGMLSLSWATWEFGFEGRWKHCFLFAPATCIPRPRRCQHRGDCRSWYLCDAERIINFFSFTEHTKTNRFLWSRRESSFSASWSPTSWGSQTWQSQAQWTPEFEELIMHLQWL